MKDRIRKLRRHFDLTQEEFAKRLGIKRNTIAQYETGRNEPIDTVLYLICHEFGVSENWLRTGEGEMLRPAPEDEIDAITRRYRLSPAETILIKKFVNLPQEKRNEFIEFILDVSQAISENGEELSASMIQTEEFTREQLHAELDRQLDLEKEAKEGSSAS